MTGDESIFQNPQLDGGSLYWKAGPVGVLLLHGFTATTTEVRPLAEFLHQHGYTVAAPLLPGHGTTPDDLNQKTSLDWVNTADDAYQGLCMTCETIFVGGSSMGGLLALFLASRYQEIAGIMLYAPAFHIPGLRLAWLAAKFRSSQPKKIGVRPMAWKGYRVNPLAAAAQLWKLRGIVDRLLPKVHQPAIIFQGRLDQTVDIRGAQMVYDKIKSSKKSLHWLDDSTHVLLLDREFDQAARQSLDFIEKTLEDSVIINTSRSL